MSVANLKTARIKAAMTKMVETCEQLATIVKSPDLRRDLAKKADVAREKIAAMEVNKP